MLKLLVVEDEVIELNSLTKIIKNHFENDLDLYTAQNGMSAKSLIEEHDFDLILSDINLPGINGLEVIKYAVSKSPNVVTLVLTSYNYFEYAQEAIKLGVENFILKPVTPNIIVEELKKAIHLISTQKYDEKELSDLAIKLNEVQPVLRSNCVYSIIKNDSSENIRDIFILLGFLPKEGFCIIFTNDSYVKSNVNKFLMIIEEMDYYWLQYNYYDQQVMFIFSTHKFDDFQRQSLSAMMNTYFLEKKHIGVGSLARAHIGFHLSYTDAIENIGAGLLLEVKEDVYEVSENRIIDIKEMCKTILSHIIMGEEDRIDELIKKFYLELTTLSSKEKVSRIEEFNDTLLMTFNEEFKVEPNGDRSEYTITIDHEQLEEQLLEEIQKVILNLTLLFKEYTDSSNVLVRKALAYIKINFSKQITLNSLAEYLDVTPFYISNLLNTHIQKGFSELVTEYRIEKSKDLLKEDIQIKEIAFSLGFQSQNYFSKVFKKMVGMTPLEYKRKKYN